MRGHRRPTLRVTDAEYERLRESAEACRRTVPEHILALAFAQLDGAAAPPPPVDLGRVDSVIRLLRNLSNNLNQIARRLNIEAKGRGRATVRNAAASRRLLAGIFENISSIETHFSRLIPTTSRVP